MRSSRIWDSVIKSLYFRLFEFGQQKPGESAQPDGCIRPGTSCPRRGTLVPPLGHLSAPVAAVDFSSDPGRLLKEYSGAHEPEYPIGTFPTESLVRDGVFPSA